MTVEKNQGPDVGDKAKSVDVSAQLDGSNGAALSTLSNIEELNRDDSVSFSINGVCVSFTLYDASQSSRLPFIGSVDKNYVRLGRSAYILLQKMISKYPDNSMCQGRYYDQLCNVIPTTVLHNRGQRPIGGFIGEISNNI